MDGLKRRSFRNISGWNARRWLPGFIVASIGLLTCGHGLAQSANSRIEKAQQQTAEVQIRVSVPRGQTIDAAELAFEDTTISLEAAPVPLPLVLWLVVDRSESVLNTAPNIRDALNTLLQGQPANTRIGLILYDSVITLYQPTTQTGEIATWLSGYSGRANAAGCLGDALAALAQQPPISGYGQRVLVITGALTRQGVCTQPGYTDVGSPIEVLVIANETDDFFQDVVDRSNGRLYRANIGTIANRMDEVRALWNNPIYDLTGSYAGQSERGRLTLTFADQSTLNLQVTLQQVAAAAEQLTTNNTGGAGNLQAMSGLPTATNAAPSLSNPAVTVSVPTADSGTGVTPVSPGNNQSAGAAPMPTQMPPLIQPTSDGLIMPTTVPVAAAQSTAAPALPPTEPPSTSERAAPDNVLNDLSNRFNVPVPVILGLGGGLGVVIIGGALLMVARRGRKRRPITPVVPRAATPQVKPLEATIIEEPTQLEWDVMPTPGFEQLPTVDEFDRTEMVEPEELGVVNFETTEMVTLDELLATQPVAGLWDARNNQTYFIRRPKTSLGREAICDIVIDYDKSLSRQHVIFHVADDSDTISLEVLTQNPILINAKAVVPAARPVLTIGDQLTLSRLCTLQLVQVEETQ